MAWSGKNNYPIGCASQVVALILYKSDIIDCYIVHYTMHHTVASPDPASSPRDGPRPNPSPIPQVLVLCDVSKSPEGLAIPDKDMKAESASTKASHCEGEQEERDRPWLCTVGVALTPLTLPVSVDAEEGRVVGVRRSTVPDANINDDDDMFLLPPLDGSGVTRLSDCTPPLLRVLSARPTCCL